MAQYHHRHHVYIDACLNHAAAVTSGDTEVAQQWFALTKSLMECYPKLDLEIAKLLYPDREARMRLWLK